MPLLLVPEDNSNRMLDAYRTACGMLAIELAMLVLFNNKQKNYRYRLRGRPIKVRNKTCGGLTTSDMIGNLSDVGINAEIKASTGGSLVPIKELIDSGKPAIIFIGHTAGQWITIWGFDDDREEMVCYDTRKKAVRDMRGLTTYSYPEIQKLWSQRTMMMKTLNFIGGLIPPLDKIKSSPNSYVAFNQ